MFGKKKKINNKIDKHENGGMKNGIIRCFVRKNEWNGKDYD